MPLYNELDTGRQPWLNQSCQQILSKLSEGTEVSKGLWDEVQIS